MKLITREIKMYRYIFGKYDVATNQVQDLYTKETPTQLTSAQIKVICNHRDGAALINKEVVPIRYTCPLDYFIEACAKYAAETAPDSTEISE